MNEQRPLDVYLNDHFAGSTAGVELAEQAAAEYSGTDLGSFFVDLLAQIQHDRVTLEDLMRRVGTQPSTIKQAGAWIMEKFSRLKLSSQTGGTPELNLLLTLETLELGVTGKLALWKALKEIADTNPQVAAFDLGALLARAESQMAALEAERLKAAKVALSATPAGVS